MNKFNTPGHRKLEDQCLELITFKHWQKEVIKKNNEIIADLLRKNYYPKEDPWKS
jgi:hypothetical protein